MKSPALSSLHIEFQGLQSCNSKEEEEKQKTWHCKEIYQINKKIMKREVNNGMCTCDVDCPEDWTRPRRFLNHVGSLYPQGSGGEACVGGLWSPRKLWLWPFLGGQWVLVPGGANRTGRRCNHTQKQARLRDLLWQHGDINISNTEKTEWTCQI